MKTNIFTIKENLKYFGFHYVLWSEGLSLRTLWDLYLAAGMLRHESTRNN